MKKKTVIKEIKAGMMTKLHQVEKSQRDNIKRNKWKF